MARSGAEDDLADHIWSNGGPGTHIEHGRVLLVGVEQALDEPAQEG